MGKAINDRQTSQLYHTAGTALPKPEMLEEGELAANISTGQTALYIKDVEDNIHVFKDSSYNDDRYVINGENPKTVDIQVTGKEGGSVREIKLEDSDDTGNTSTSKGITISDKSSNGNTASIVTTAGETIISNINNSGGTNTKLSIESNGIWYKKGDGERSEISTHRMMRYTRARLSEKKNKADEELIPSHSTLQDARVKIGNFVYVSKNTASVTCYDYQDSAMRAYNPGILYEIANFKLSGTAINYAKMHTAIGIQYTLDSDTNTPIIGIYADNLEPYYEALGGKISNCKIIIEITGVRITNNTNKIYYGALTNATKSDGGYYQFKLPSFTNNRLEPTYHVYVTIPSSRFRDGILWNKKLSPTLWSSYHACGMFKNTSNQWVKVRKNNMMFRVAPDLTDEWKPQHMDYVDSNDISLNSLATAIATPSKYQVWYRVASVPRPYRRGDGYSISHSSTDSRFKWRLCGRKLNGEVNLSYLPNWAKEYYNYFNDYKEVYFDDFTIYPDDTQTPGTKITPVNKTLYKDYNNTNFYYLPNGKNELVCIFHYDGLDGSLSDEQFAQLENIIGYRSQYVKKSVSYGSSLKGLYTYSFENGTFIKCSDDATMQMLDDTEYFEQVYSADGGFINSIDTQAGALAYIKRCFKSKNKRTGDVANIGIVRPLYIDFAVFKVKKYHKGRACNHRATTENIGKVYRLYWDIKDPQQKHILKTMFNDGNSSTTDAIKYNHSQREFFDMLKFLRAIPAFKNRKK